MRVTKDQMCWPTVEAAALGRIDELRVSLETARKDDVERLQGEVAGLRWLLRQAEPPTIPLLTSME